jgi:hypothetical protein
MGHAEGVTVTGDCPPRRCSRTITSVAALPRLLAAERQAVIQTRRDAAVDESYAD